MSRLSLIDQSDQIVNIINSHLNTTSQDNGKKDHTHKNILLHNTILIANNNKLIIELKAIVDI